MGFQLWPLRETAVNSWSLWSLPYLLHCTIQGNDIEARSARAATLEEIQPSHRWVQGTREGEIVGRFLKAQFPASSPLLAIDSAGVIPFFSELPTVDMLGLNDSFHCRTIPR